MTTESIIRWLRDRALGAEYSWRFVMLEAAKRLERENRHGHWVPVMFVGHKQWHCSECQTLGSPQWKRCPVCEVKMDMPNITDQTQSALEKMGRKAHKEE